MSRTLLDKIWDAHAVASETQEHPAILYIDMHLLHEVTSPQAFAALRERGISVRRPERCLATLDHSTPTTPLDERGRWPWIDEHAERQIEALLQNVEAAGIACHGVGSPNRGIVHVMGPELGATWPGRTIVCGDSHTATHGAFGALAFGIGTTEVGHVLATQCLLQRKPRSMAVEINGEVGPWTEAKDVVLAVLAKIGSDGGTGAVIEYRGDTVTRFDMEERMTLCNMSIEGGARAGMVAPDAKTWDWLQGRPMAPSGEEWDRQIEAGADLRSDANATFDDVVSVDVQELGPHVTWGTTPSQGGPVSGVVPEPGGVGSERALEYMDLTPGDELRAQKIDEVFVGSCTNGRLGDLRRAAEVLRGKRVARGVRMLVVPGSERVKATAESEGLDRVFRDAGAEWREPGCSMCIAMNGDVAAPGQFVVSTSNRNFQGRQGPGSRTFLAGAAVAAASAVKGRLADPAEVCHG